MEDIILVGYGGHAKSVADCIEREGKYHIVGYTDIEKQVSPYRYLGTDEILKGYLRKGICNVVICLGYMGKDIIREQIFRKLKALGFQFPVIIDPTAIISESSEIGEGTFIGKGAIVNIEAKIGKMCIINTGAIIEHECEIMDFSHVAVGAVICGQVTVNKAAFIGANATIIQCQEINSRQIVPAGMVIRETLIN